MADCKEDEKDEGGRGLGELGSRQEGDEEEWHAKTENSRGQAAQGTEGSGGNGRERDRRKEGAEGWSCFRTWNSLSFFE
eukprot:768607-Hanusia_phi.AAC.7